MALTLEKKLMCLFYNIHDLDIPSPPINISKQLKIGIIYFIKRTTMEIYAHGFYSALQIRSSRLSMAKTGMQNKKTYFAIVWWELGRRRFPGSYTYE